MTNTGDPMVTVGVPDRPSIEVAVASSGGPPGPPGPGVAEGGTTGEILAKASDADFDTEWIEPPEGGGGGGNGALSGRVDALEQTIGPPTNLAGDASIAGTLSVPAILATGAFGTPVVSTRVTGESVARLAINSDGTLTWGTGDTNLTALGVRITGTSTATNSFQVLRSGARFTVGPNGAVTIGPTALANSVVGPLLMLGNNATEPATPTAGGILWASAGVLKYKRPDGTVVDLSEPPEAPFMGDRYVRLTTTGQTWTVPQGVTTCRVRTRDGGGGGGGGSNSSGSGGAAGVFADVTIPVTAGHVLSATIGAGGVGGAAGAFNTAAGGNGGNTTRTELRNTSAGNVVIAGSWDDATLIGAGRGGAGTGTRGYTAAPVYGNIGTYNTGSQLSGVAGSGGIGGHRYPAPLVCVMGGGGGDPWTGSANGRGGGAQQSSDPLGFLSRPPGPNGQDATEPGCGGGGGGSYTGSAAPPDGTPGGAGGAGAPGVIEIWF